MKTEELRKTLLIRLNLFNALEAIQTDLSILEEELISKPLPRLPRPHAKKTKVQIVPNEIKIHTVTVLMNIGTLITDTNTIILVNQKAGTKTIEASGIRIPNTQSIMRNITNSFMIIKNYKNSKSVYKISKGKQHHSQEKTVQIL